MPVNESAYVPLANVTLGSNASTVTFSSISQSYRDLVFVFSATTTGTAFSRMRINGDTGANYFWVTLTGNGADPSSQGGNGGSNIPLPVNGTMESTTRWTNIIHIMDYSTTNKHKSGIQRADQATERTAGVAFRWGSTSAITSVEFAGNNNPFVAGSTFALYGIAS